MKQTLSALFVAILTLLIACSFGGPTDSSGDVIWPLADGSEWQGTLKHYDSADNLVSESPLTFYISGDTTVHNRTWYFFGAYTDEPPKVGVSYWLLSNQSDGLHQIFLPIFFREPEAEPEDHLWFKYPASVGDGYRVNDYDSITVTSVDYLVGARRCIVYNYHYSYYGHKRYYVAPGVGLIRYEEETPYDYHNFAAQAPHSVWELKRLVIK